jgi:hypothetical protein
VDDKPFALGEVVALGREDTDNYAIRITEKL